MLQMMNFKKDKEKVLSHFKQQVSCHETIRDKLKIISYVLSMFWALSTTRSNAKHGKIKAQDFVNYL